MRIGAALLLTACLCSSETRAADDTGLWHGPGAITCTAFIEHRDAGRDNAFRWWLFGWTAAHNKLLDHTYALIPDEPAFERAILWLDGYCRVHPAQTLVDAAVALTESELYPKRLIAKPR
jgi:hypothetical protein